MTFLSGSASSAPIACNRQFTSPASNPFVDNLQISNSAANHPRSPGIISGTHLFWVRLSPCPASIPPLRSQFWMGEIIRAFLGRQRLFVPAVMVSNPHSNCLTIFEPVIGIAICNFYRASLSILGCLDANCFFVFLPIGCGSHRHRLLVSCHVGADSRPNFLLVLCVVRSGLNGRSASFFNFQFFGEIGHA